MLIHNNFRSWCLQTNTDIDVIIPDCPNGENPGNYYSSNLNFPILWLLHGTWGGYNDFVRRTNIDLYAKESKIMVVMPNAMNSDYSNWHNFMTGYNMYDFLTEELMPMIYNWFPASNKRNDNYIGGISMGAIGAMKYAVNHPDLFAGCSAMSGVPTDVATAYKSGKIDKRLQNSINNAGGIEQYLNSYENVWGKCADIAKLGKDCPNFYISCGKQDFLYNDYLAFKKYAEDINFKAYFEEIDGYQHEWRFWNMQIEKTIKYFGFKTQKNVTTKEQVSKAIDPSLL